MFLLRRVLISLLSVIPAYAGVQFYHDATSPSPEMGIYIPLKVTA
jgi:hypothetical protein